MALTIMLSFVMKKGSVKMLTMVRTLRTLRKVIVAGMRKEKRINPGRRQ